MTEYISQFLAKSGHYNQTDSSDVKYLSEDLNLSKMFRYFISIHRHPATEEDPPVTRWVVPQYFKETLLTSKCPRSDEKLRQLPPSLCWNTTWKLKRVNKCLKLKKEERRNEGAMRLWAEDFSDEDPRKS